MVKCSDCGFLAARTLGHADSLPQFVELQEGQRTDKHISQTAWYDTHLYCFMRETWFQEKKGQVEYGYLTDLSPLIDVEHDCESFTPWQQGFGPKEHWDMVDRERIVRWQAEREEADRTWREEQRRLDADWRENQERRSDRRHRWDIFWVAVVATFILAAVTIVAAFIERGKLF